MPYTCDTTGTTADGAWVTGTSFTLHDSTTTATAAWTNWTVELTAAWDAWVTFDQTATTSVWVEIRSNNWQWDRHYELRERLLRRRAEREVQEKASALLRWVLTEEQWQDWRRYESVRVQGSEGGLYEVGVGWSGMLYKLDPETQEPLKKLCCHPPSDYPAADRVAAMVLALRSDEAEILRKANTHDFPEHEKRRVAVRRAHRRRAA